MLTVLRRRGGFAWLALFALGLQFVLSFAHRQHHEAPAQTAAVGLASGSQFVGGASRGNDDGAHVPAESDEEGQCSICWAVALSHVLLLPVLLAGLIDTLQSGKQWTSIYTPARLAGRLAFPFAPRGPPGL